MKLRKVTLTLFILAGPCYFFSDKIGIGLALLGVALEIAGWVSLFNSQDDSSKDESKK